MITRCEMQSHLICVLVGLPASGKTSFANQVDVFPFRKVIFSYDELQLNEENYKTYRRKVQDQLERLIQDELLVETTESHSSTVVIVDDIMILRSMRYDIFKLARKFRLGFGQIFLNTDLQLCILRNRVRDVTDVTDDMIISQSKRLEVPGNSKSLMDKFVLEIKDNQFSNEIVLNFLEVAAKEPVPELKDPSRQATQSIVHQIDLVLRRHIGRIITQQSTAEAKSLLAHELNCRRQELLQDVRERNLVFEEPLEEDQVLNHL